MSDKSIEAHLQRDKLKHGFLKYFTALISVLLSCQYHSHKQRGTPTKKTDIVALWLIWSSFLFTLFYVYLWLMVKNNCYLIAKVLFKIFGHPSPLFRVIIGTMILANVYVNFIMVLCLLHMVLGLKVQINLFHWFLLVLILVFCMAVTFFIDIYFSQFWAMTYLSFKIFGPYIHIVSVTICTSFSWLFYRYWFKLMSKVEKAIWMTIWLFTLAILYLIPIFFHSINLMSSSGKKPEIIAVGGASDVAPENTLFAFQKAIDLGADGLFVTIQFSKDNIPLIMSDNTLTWTTDFKQKFGANASDFVGSYTVQDLQTLDAGSWFLHTDPCGTVDSLSNNETLMIKKSKILTWNEFLNFISHHKGTKVFVKFSSLLPFQVIYKQMASHRTVNVSNFYFPSTAFQEKKSHAFLENIDSLDSISKNATFDVVCLDTKILIDKTITEFSQLNIKTVLKGVNTFWLYSFAWLIGANFVTTYNVKMLNEVHFPLNYMDGAVYFTLLVTLVFLSILINSFSFLAQSFMDQKEEAVKEQKDNKSIKEMSSSDSSV